MAAIGLGHGAWHGAWCREQLRPELERRSHRVVAVRPAALAEVIDHVCRDACD